MGQETFLPSNNSKMHRHVLGIPSFVIYSALLYTCAGSLAVQYSGM